MPAGDVKGTWTDINKVEKNADYKPQSNIKDGINSFIRWYNKFFNNE